MCDMTQAGDLSDEGVQQAVDLLEMVLSRPVILEDPMLRPIAYSKQPDDIDGARLSVILNRGVQPEFLRMCHTLGIHTAKSPLWTPARPDWKMEQRLCIPVRDRRTLLAYLWVLAPQGSLSPQQIDTAVTTAKFVATALDANRRQRRSTEQNSQLALARLLGSDDHSTLVAGLATDDNVPPDSRVVVLVFEPPVDGAVDGDGKDVVDSVLAIKEHLPGTDLPVRWMVHLTDQPAVLALLSADSGPSEATIGAAVQSSLSLHYKQPVRVGSGGDAAPLSEVREAYERAKIAVWVSRTARADAMVTSWTDIGSWRLLAKLLGGMTGTASLSADLHPGLANLLEENNTDLVDTLEVFLANGGDVRTTAQTLHLHRSTLYYRIDRISQITGANLRDGEAIFELMLGLRVAALIGLR